MLLGLLLQDQRFEVAALKQQLQSPSQIPPKDDRRLHRLAIIAREVLKSADLRSLFRSDDAGICRSGTELLTGIRSLLQTFAYLDLDSKPTNSTHFYPTSLGWVNKPGGRCQVLEQFWSLSRSHKRQGMLISLRYGVPALNQALPKCRESLTPILSGSNQGFDIDLHKKLECLPSCDG